MGQASASAPEAPGATSPGCCRQAGGPKPDRRVDTVKVQLPDGLSAPGAAEARCCSPCAADVSAPDPGRDTVSVPSKNFKDGVDQEDVADEKPVSPTASPSEKLKLDLDADIELDKSTSKSKSKPRAFEPQSGSFACGFGPAVGPEVQVANIASRSATVSWKLASRLRNLRKWHIEVIDGIEEMAFFETDGDSSSFDVPLGTLQRASGPYCFQVAAETGPAGAEAKFSMPGVSRTFWTPAEAPGPAVWPRLTEAPTEDRICVEWDAPIDDGGSPIQEYRIALSKDLQDASALAQASELEIKPLQNVAQSSKIRTWATKKTSHIIDGLAPASGPYRIEVGVVNEAGLVGPTDCVVARTAVAQPGVPTATRARLLSVPPTKWGDANTLRIDFRAPLYDGCQKLEYFKVSAVEDEEPAGKTPTLRAVCEVTFAEAAQHAGQTVPDLGCACACDVEVSPNKAYSFVVQASNGDRLSSVSESTPEVLVPARVPSPPALPPEVHTEQGGVAELRWECPEIGGGMPVTFFKVGIVRSSDCRDGDIASNVSREVAIPRGSAQRQTLAGCDAFVEDDEGEPLLGDDEKTMWVARIDGLEADTRYSFVIAASNCLGTGCWSEPSALVSTPVAAPTSPANPVATVALDAQRQTVVTVAWETGQIRVGTGAVIAFHLAVIFEQVGEGVPKALLDAVKTKRKDWKCGRVLHERLPVPDAKSSKRMTWSAPLLLPGRYRMELTAENTMGQRSAPAVLALNVSPEAFAPPPEPDPLAPRWADEALLLRGGCDSKLTATELREQRKWLVGPDSDKREWLQGILLWDGSSCNVSPTAAKKKMDWSTSSSHAPSVDVVCFYRSPAGPAEAQVAILAKAVTASRLHVALPADVPMSLRLAARADPPHAGACGAPKTYVDMPQSDALLLLLSEDGCQLSAHWEVWSRNSPSGCPPRWAPLPSELHGPVETAWREGESKVTITIEPRSSSNENCEHDLAPGTYQLTFGDDRRVQHTVKRLGHGGWQAKARRTVFSLEGEDVAKSPAEAEDQCVICMERRRTHAFMHADTGDGHLAVCSTCVEAYRAELAAGSASQAFRTCPMCRRPFSAVQRIYQ